MRTLAALLLAFALTFLHAARAVEPAKAEGQRAKPSTLDPRPSTLSPWLKAGDVVALVGGEDMVALAEEGWLETLVTWAQPGDRIRWRSLAWEGDTVFEQRRDLNYPTLEAQLDRMGATVVLCQFGKMESFAGKEGVAAFTEAYEKLLARLSGEKKRRIALVLPPRFGPPRRSIAPQGVPDLSPRNADLAAYRDAIRGIASKLGALLLDAENPAGPGFQTVATREEAIKAALAALNKSESQDHGAYPTRDGIHMVKEEMLNSAIAMANSLGAAWWTVYTDRSGGMGVREKGRIMVVAKNRLWHHYTRPQNWAFLAGNRTNQPSSRDHRDPSKRWFPEEMEQWVPLIEAKEKEIWSLAAAPR